MVVRSRRTAQVWRARKVFVNGTSSLRLDYDDEWYDELGYHLVEGKSGPMDISLLTSSISYEKRVQRRADGYFTILTLNKDSHHWTS